MNATTSTPAPLFQALHGLEPQLKAHVLGQDAVLKPIIAALLRAELGLAPRGRFLLLGPTGVGKSETVLAFTDHLFGRDRLFRFDMSEFQTPDSLGVLLGDRTGDRGRFGAMCRQTKTGTLLFDEIEKAHRGVCDLLLQILEPGHVTLACGETLDLRGFYVVCTGNIASREVLDLQHSSFTTLERHILAHARDSLRPELFNRFDETLVFRPLEYETQVDIVRQKLTEYVKSLTANNRHVSVDERVVSFVLRHGFDRSLGARPLRRAVSKFVGDAVARDLMAGGSGSGHLVPEDSVLVLRPKAATSEPAGGGIR